MIAHHGSKGQVSYTEDEREAKEYNLKPFRFKCLHIPSNQIVDRVIYGYFYDDLRYMLNDWNRIGEATWKYWEE